MRDKLVRMYQKAKYAVSCAATSAAVMATQAQIAMAGGAGTADTENIVKTVLDQIILIFPLVGAFFIISGFFKLVMAYRSDNPEGQSGAAKDIVVGAVFVTFAIFWGPISDVIF